MLRLLSDQLYGCRATSTTGVACRPLLAIPAVLAGSLLAVTAPAQAYGQAPSIPAEIAPHVPKNLRPYFVAFLVSPAIPKEMSRDLFVRHQAYIRSQFEKRVYRIAGPITGAGRIRGLVILTASTADEARAIVAADPAVQEKVFGVEVHPGMFPSLESVAAEYSSEKP